METTSTPSAPANVAHAPGPWSIEREGARIHVKTPAGETIASFWAGVPECEANARLIAAAPELLAALQRYVRYADSTGVTRRDASMVELSDMDAQARAALAKATT